MNKTLYLHEARDLEVVRDGPSLWIKQRGLAGRRVPARLVDMVIIIGTVRIDTGVLTLFTDNNIPVTCMNKRGQETAVTMPYNHQLPVRYEEQQIFFTRDEGILRFEQWLLSERKRIQLNTVKRLSKNIAGLYLAQGFKEADYRNFVRQYKPADEDKRLTIETLIGNFFREMLISGLMAAGLDPHMGVLHRRRNFGLALDLCHAMEGEVDIQTVRFLQRSPGEWMLKGKRGWEVSRDGMKDIIHRFENRKRANLVMAEHLIDELFELMRELKYEGKLSRVL
jgi:CRISPR/Cas system-associated endonuclease Cas1